MNLFLTMESEENWLTSDDFKGSFNDNYILGEMIGRYKRYELFAEIRCNCNVIIGYI